MAAGYYTTPIILFIALLGILIAVYYNLTLSQSAGDATSSSTQSIFQFTVDKIDDGQPVVLSEYKGKKAYLVVNVASKCGLTNRNYAELQDLYDKLSPQGLEILAFPCNNFGGQEPGSGTEILTYARQEKEATFPILGKLECDNGDLTHPLYKFLKGSLKGGILGQGLKWNFAKFLVDAEGRPVKRYLPIANPLSLEEDIVKLLQA